MTWTRLGDNFYDRPDLGRVSRSARLLFVEMLVYCNRELLDGAFPKHMVRRICDDPEVDDLVLELTAVGAVVELDDGVLQVDWSDQEQADVVRERHARNAERQRAYRLRKELHAAGDHTKCSAPYCKSVTRNVDGHVTGHVEGLVTPSRPVPSRPGGTGDRDAGAAGAGAPPHPLRAAEWLDVSVDEVETGHVELTVSLKDGMEQHQDAFAALAADAQVGLAGAIANLAERHGCDGGCKIGGDPAEWVWVTIPEPVSAQWASRLVAAFCGDAELGRTA